MCRRGTVAPARRGRRQEGVPPSSAPGRSVAASTPDPGAPDPAWAAQEVLHDELTGLPNRRRLQDEVETAVGSARDAGAAIALLHVDLVDFRRVVDTLGPDLADELRRRIAVRLRREVRGGELLARSDADTFAVLVTDLAPPGTVAEPAHVRRAVQQISERIISTLAEPFAVAGTEMLLAVAVGACVYPEGAADAVALRRRADAAMYEARRVPSRIVVHSVDTPDPLARLELAARLRRAVGRGELELHYQPIAMLPSGGVTGVEALVRWRDPERGLVSPDAFIPLAESTGVIEALGDWVLEECCRQAAEWEREGLRPNIGYNVSPRQLRRPGFADGLTRRLHSHGLSPDRLIVELTESAWSVDAEDLLPRLAALRVEGLALAIDDFGAGYSSLWRLRELPVQIIKLDRALLRGVPADEKSREIVLAVLQLAAACGCDVVAEGVETREQLDLLTAAGCRFAQGFLLARPAPAAEITPLLRTQLAVSRR